MPTKELLQRVLACPMDENENGARAENVGQYLITLLETIWIEGEGFSGKRPFGDSSWEYDVYVALAKGGLISGLELDEEGYVDSFTQEGEDRANRLILQAIRSLG